MLLAIELLKRIPRHTKITATELRDQLAAAGHVRNLRSIQRLLSTLSEDLEIECDTRNKPYGYRWKERSNGLNLPVLSEQESLLLALAQEHLRHLLPQNLFKSMEGFFSQAQSNLNPYSKAKKEREWLQKVRVVSTTQPLLPPQVDATVLEEVSNALYANKWLEIEYRNANDKVTNSKVMPLGLAQQGPRLYLACRFDGHDNERSLALHRIAKAKATPFEFERPQFDLEQYDADGRFGFGEGVKVRLTFVITKIAGRHLLESPLALDQTVIDQGEEYQICATVVDTAQLEWWLRGFGTQVRNVVRASLL
ncbi:WYL domain-containing protein [Undibacterium amnicola]|uniref:helix-turn-helix transcriptional regulator n=1 Tax=Undibacterium amnicola TaxID=1834038 RepID=UPI0031B6423A